MRIHGTDFVQSKYYQVGYLLGWWYPEKSCFTMKERIGICFLICKKEALGWTISQVLSHSNCPTRTWRFHDKPTSICRVQFHQPFKWKSDTFCTHLGSSHERIDAKCWKCSINLGGYYLCLVKSKDKWSQVSFSHFGQFFKIWNLCNLGNPNELKWVDLNLTFFFPYWRRVIILN